MTDTEWRNPPPIALEDNWSVEFEYRIAAGRVEVRVTNLHYSIKDLVKDEVEREALLARLVRAFLEKRVLK